MAEALITEFKKMGHISYATCGESQYQCIVNCPTHIMHGKKIWKIATTRKNEMGVYGKTRTSFYLENDAKPFKTIESLLTHYKIQN